MMKEYKSPLDIHVGPTDGELGVTLRMRKDGHICILSVDPDLCPPLYEAAANSLLKPGHPIATIDRAMLICRPPRSSGPMAATRSWCADGSIPKPW